MAAEGAAARPALPGGSREEELSHHSGSSAPLVRDKESQGEQESAGVAATMACSPLKTPGLLGPLRSSQPGPLPGPSSDTRSKPPAKPAPTTAITFGQSLPGAVQTAAGSSTASFGGFGGALTTSAPITCTDIQQH
ncbi:Nuclear envelope pore membrane protein POM 121C [Manis javanica]|nr:Nuclear envelope pore membrane protein POM 121C [Manis javanica]